MAVTADLATALAAPARGATLVQLRAPKLPARSLEELASRLVAESPVPVVISSRVDVALASGAAGVNLPEADLPVAEARRLLGPERLVGRSVHSAAEAASAEVDGADYVVFGPIFETPSHPSQAGLGLDELAAVAAAISVPVLAIGGVDRERGRECLAAGAAGFAAVRLFQ